MGLVSPMILPVAVLCPSCWSVELLGEALLGIFCSCSAATLPYTVIPPTNREVIELSNTLGALQVGGSSANCVCFSVITLQSVKEEQFPYLCIAFQMKTKASS